MPLTQLEALALARVPLALLSNKGPEAVSSVISQWHTASVPDAAHLMLRVPLVRLSGNHLAQACCASCMQSHHDATDEVAG